MDAITAVIRRIEQVWIRRAAYDLVEVDHAIKACTCAYPLVDLIAYPGFRVVPAGVVRGRLAVMPGNDRGADHFNTFGFDASDDVFRSRDQFLGADVTPDIVRAHEQHDMTDARMRQHIPVETVHSRGAVRLRSQVRAGHGISADSLVDDRPPDGRHHGQTLSDDVFPPVMRIQRRAGTV